MIYRRIMTRSEDNPKKIYAVLGPLSMPQVRFDRIMANGCLPFYSCSLLTLCMKKLVRF